MPITKEAAKERTKRLLEQNPDYFRELAAKSHLKPRKNYSFNDRELARRAGIASSKSPNFNFADPEKARSIREKALEAKRAKKKA